VQLRIQDRFLAPLLAGTAPASVPRLAGWLDAWQPLRHAAARLLGLGIRPEHLSEALRTPAS
jgi:hypothetical protein